MNGLCSKCKSFKVDKALYRIKNCPTENSLVAFSHNHKVEAIIVSCKEFLLLPYPRKGSKRKRRQRCRSSDSVKLDDCQG